MQRICALIIGFSFALLACEHAEAGKGPKSKLNSARCVSDVECGENQRCVKEEHRPDGICASK